MTASFIKSKQIGQSKIFELIFSNKMYYSLLLDFNAFFIF
jgi:hypothetical protein